MLAASILALLGHVIANDSIIRRHPTQEETSVHLTATGQLQQLVKAQDGITTKVASGNINGCNIYYTFGDDDSNTCSKSYTVNDPAPVTDPDECEQAVAYLPGGAASSSPSGITMANLSQYVVDNGWENPLPYTKNCFLNTYTDANFPLPTDTVYYNPTQTEPTAYKGKPVCKREKYPSGTANTVSSTAGVCPTDFEVITSVADCHKAFVAVLGKDGCQEAKFEDGAVDWKPTDRPKGCYREPTTGCFNFNHIATEGTAVQGNVVCKVSGVAVECCKNLDGSCVNHGNITQTQANNGVTGTVTR